MRTNEELLQEIQFLKTINKQLKEQIFQDDLTKFPWLGNLGHWFWDYQANVVDFNPLKAQSIGYEMDEVPEHPGFQFFTEKLHPEDYERIMAKMRAHLNNETPVWEVKYRIRAKDGSWRVYYDRGKVTQRTPEGKPLFLAGIVFDITEDEEKMYDLIQEAEYWQRQARFDSLTNLYSRSELMHQLEDFHAKGRNYSLWMFDIDYFKAINDSYGHLAGDELLHRLGHLIKKGIHNKSFAGRYGGDEFIVVFPDMSKDQALEIAQGIQRELSKWDTPSNTSFTLSGGIVEKQDGNDLKALLELADKRLYQAKKRGRDQIDKES